MSESDTLRGGGDEAEEDAFRCNVDKSFEIINQAIRLSNNPTETIVIISCLALTTYAGSHGYSLEEASEKILRAAKTLRPPKKGPLK